MEKVIRGGAKCCALRGREMLHPKRTDYGKAIRKDYENHNVTVPRSMIQQLEPRKDGIANCVTTVSKDCMYIAEVEMEEEKTLDDYLYHGKDGNDYGIFKLSPRECLRLMNVFDTDIDKMAAVNSNSQLYKTAGNSIVVSVLCAIFSQLHIQGIKPWNERTEEERKELIYDKNFMDK